MHVRSTCLALLLASTSACGGSMAEMAPSVASAQSGAATGARPRADGRLMVRTADLTLEVSDESDIDPTLARIAALADGNQGHTVHRSGDYITVKVPADKLDATLKDIEGLGEVTRRNISAQDVTADHADLAVRIENLKRLQARLRELVQQADQVPQILEIEREMARVTGELERMEAQMRDLTGQVELSRVSVSVEESVSPGPVGWIFYGLYHGVKWLFVWD